jgi:hypothetical protein
LVFASLLLFGCSRELPAERALTASPEIARSAARSVAPSDALAPANTRASGIAVVELFTSEGCSSCPPADRVLARLAARAKLESLPIFALSFHVDYWNDLGWRDRFSSADYSARQRNYASIGAGGGLYTPQAVINGGAETVGSDASRIDALVSSALQRAPRTQIVLDARRGAHGIEVDYHVSGETLGRVINLAVVEPRAESQVERGENAGQRLAHSNVVRGFETRTLSATTSGTWTPALEPASMARRVGIIAYTEGAAQRDISGASALEL